MNFMTAEVVIDVNLTRVTSDFRRAERLATRTIRNVERTHLRMIRDTERASRAAARASVAFHRRIDRIIKRTYRNMTRAATRAFATIKRTAKIAAAAFLAVGVAAVKMAMDAEESENLFEVSMGKMASATRKWSDELSTALGLNAFEVRKTVGTFNVMFTSMGLGAEAARDMAQGLTMLTQDMASFFNLRPEEAFQKLQAGITGEAEPLKRLGILVNETTTKMFALENGIGDATGKLTEQQKVLARYGLILKQTTMAQGDMERTLDSTTNVFRSLWSRIQETAIGIGNKLLPAVTKVAKKMRDWLVDNQKEIEEWAGVFIKWVEVVIAKMKDLWAVFKGEGIVAGLKVIGAELFNIFEGVVDVLLILAIAAGKGIIKGILGIGKPSRDEILNEYLRLGVEVMDAINAGMATKDWDAAAKMREAEANLRLNQLKEEIGLIEQLGAIRDRVLGRAGQAIPGQKKPAMDQEFKVPALIDIENMRDPSQIVLPLTSEGLAVQGQAGFDFKILNEQMIEDQKTTDAILIGMAEERAAYEIGQREAVANAAIEATERAIEATKYAADAAKELSDKQVTQAQASIDHIQSLNFLSHNERLTQMDELIEVKRALWAEESDAMALLADERQRYADQHKEGWDAVHQSMMRFYQDAINWGKNLGDVLVSAFKSAGDAFADSLVDGIDNWKSFARSFLKELMSMIFQLWIAVALKTALQGWSGMFPSMGQTGTGGTGATVPGISEALDTGFATGGSVLETGIAKIHKGEQIIPANQVGGLTINIENNAGVQVDVEQSPDERTYSVILTALSGDGPMRRAVSSIRR